MLPLTGTTDPAHMREDLGIYDFELSAEDVRLMEDIAGGVRARRAQGSFPSASSGIRDRSRSRSPAHR